MYGRFAFLTAALGYMEEVSSSQYEEEEEEEEAVVVVVVVNPAVGADDVSNSSK